MADETAACGAGAAVTIPPDQPAAFPLLSACERRLIIAMRERRARNGRRPTTFVLRFDGLAWMLLEGQVISRFEEGGD